MSLLFPHLFLFTLVWVTLSAVTDECVYKGCYCTQDIIDCGIHGLNQIPNPDNIIGAGRTLILDFNNITEIPAGSLPSNLTAIQLVNNPTTIIADTAFDGSIYTLQKLNFAFALFTRIPNALRSLKTLKDLTILDTNVQDWNEEAMINIGQTLVSLNLYNVGLTSWPNWMQNFSELTDLTISGCSIQSIPDGALDKVTTSLLSLALINNSLTSVPKALSKLSGLVSLNLEQNNIIDVTWLPQGSQLSTLWLNNNKITNAHVLSQALVHIGTTLVDLDIHFNELTSIPDFTSLTRIGNFDLSHNKISDPYSGSVLPTIYSIDVRYNFLPAIPRLASTLEQATDLTFAWNIITEISGTDLPPSATLVDVGYNLITELTDNSFPENSQLTSLHLNHNPIVTISNMAFRNLAYLSELNLRNTQLTRLPLALRSLTGLSMFDMTDCADLVCTCMEKGLEPWVASLLPNNVLGNCGEMSIYGFLTELSPSCPTK